MKYCKYKIVDRLETMFDQKDDATMLEDLSVWGWRVVGYSRIPVPDHGDRLFYNRYILEKEIEKYDEA